jgi:hypothetical protein
VELSVEHETAAVERCGTLVVAQVKRRSGPSTTVERENTGAGIGRGSGYSWCQAVSPAALRGSFTIGAA